MDETKLDIWHAASPARTFAKLTAVTALLSLWGAPEILDEVRKSEMLADSPRVEQTLTAVAKLSDAIGIQALKRGLGGVRRTFNQRVEWFDDRAVGANHGLPGGTPTTSPGSSDSGVVDSAIASAPEHRVMARKRRVLVIGASSIQFAVGVELERSFREYEGVAVERYGQLATGLSRPDFFDWPAKLDELASRFRPDLVVANFGGNGAQDIKLGEYETAAFRTKKWDEVYGKRVTELIQMAHKHGADIVFLGMPIMRSKRFSAKMKHLNAVQREAATAAGVMWIPTWSMAATSDGKYRTAIKYRGRRGLMRTSDGVHYTKLGARFVIEQVRQILERHFVLPPKDQDLAVAARHELDSRALEETVAYVLYEPRPGAANPRTLLLFPGTRWQQWPSFPHRRLQKLAQRHGTRVVVFDGLDPKDGEIQRAFVNELVPDLREHVGLPAGLAIAGPDTSALSGALTEAGISHAQLTFAEERLGELFLGTSSPKR